MAKSICGVFLVQVEALQTALANVERAGPCGPLWLEACSAVLALAVSAHDLVEVLRFKGGAGQDAARAVGVVWGSAESLAKQVPRSNRVAFRRVVMAKRYFCLL